MNRRKFLLSASVAAVVAANIGVFAFRRLRRQAAGLPNRKPAPDEVLLLAFGVDGKRLVSVTRAGELSVWDSASSKRISSHLAKPIGKVLPAGCLFDDALLALASDTGIVKFWKSIDNGSPSLSSVGSQISCIAFRRPPRGVSSPPISAAIATPDHSIRIVERVSGKFTGAFGALNPSLDSTASPSTFVEFTRLLGHSAEVAALHFSANNDILISGSKDRTAKVWNGVNWQLLKSFDQHDSAVTSVSTSLDGRMAASGTESGTISVWDLETLSKVGVLSGHSDAINSLLFSKDSDFLVSSASDHTTRVWSLKSLQETYRLPDSPSKFNTAELSADGKRLARTCGSNVEFWEMVKLTSDANRNV